MAIITKIRERSGLTIGIILVGLVAFLVGGDLLSSNSQLLNRNQQIAGEIDGEDVDLQVFRNKVEELRGKYSLSLNRQPNENEMSFIRAEAWNELVYDQVFQGEFDKLGIQVTAEEITDMVQGNNIHPAFAQRFRNPQTGEVDRNMIVAYLQNITRAPREEQIQFAVFESSLGPNRSREKYANLMALSSYVPKAEAKAVYEAQNSRADASYVFVPYASVKDEDVKVTDEMMSAYYSAHKEEFKTEASRSLEYVAFPISASSADSADAKKDMEDMAARFTETKDDTAFVQANSDAPSIRRFRTDELPEELDGQELTPGKVWGPFLKGDSYVLYKLTAIKEDTVNFVKASHILFDIKDRSKEEAKKDADEILKKVSEDGADFGFYARQYNSDATRNTDGDLGWFKDGDMVKPFNDAAFAASSTGIIPRLIETEFGYHIINVTQTKTKTSYAVASVSRQINASEETRDRAYSNAGKFAEATNVQEYVKTVESIPGTISLQALNIKRDASNINNLTGTQVREVIRWAYEAELEQISNVFELDGYYLVVMLKGITPEGIPAMSEITSKVREAVIKEEKANTILAKLKGASGDLEKIAAAYGQGIQVQSTEGFSFNTNVLRGVGSATKAIGKAYAMKVGERTEPIKEAAGIIILQLDKREEASEVADYAIYKDQLRRTRNNQIDSRILEAVKSLANVKSDIAKFY